MTYTSWSFTIQIPECLTAEQAGEMWKPDHMKYLVFQCESGTHAHVQGYVHLTSRRAMSSVKNIFQNPGMHLEPAKGSAEQNRTYCTKEETRIGGPWEFGEMPQPGRRNDLKRTTDKIHTGKRLAELALDPEEAVNIVKYHRGLSTLEYLLSRATVPTERNMQIITLYGPSRIGKTHWVYQRYPATSIYKVAQYQPIWWDGYYGQDILLVDDFNGEWPLAYIKQVLDKWPFQCAVKGQFVPAAYTKVLITSNYGPDEWYKFAKDDEFDPLRQRLTGPGCLCRHVLTKEDCMEIPTFEECAKLYSQTDGQVVDLLDE